MFTKRKIFIYTIVLAVTLLGTIFCILILVKNNNFKQQYAFNLALPNKSFYENAYGCSIQKILSYRNFITYEINGDNNRNTVELKKIQLAIKRIVKNNDGKDGIHVRFSLTTKYDDFIKVLDICEIEKAPTYILDQYNLWIMAGTNKKLAEDCPLKIPN